MSHSNANSSKIQQASVAIADWLDIDMVHIENQLMLNINQAFGQANKDWFQFSRQCEFRDESHMHLKVGDIVSTDQYACTLCHKSFKTNSPDMLHDCHSCSGKEFYQAKKYDGPIYLH